THTDTLSLHDALPIYPREFTTRPSWQRPAPLAGGELREHYRRDSAYLQSPKDLRSYGMGSSSEPGENRSAALERKNMAENKLARSEEHTSELQSPDHL